MNREVDDVFAGPGVGVRVPVKFVDVGRIVELLVLMGDLFIGVFDWADMGTFEEGEAVAGLAPAFSWRFSASKLNKSFFAHGSSFFGASCPPGPKSPPCPENGLKSPLAAWKSPKSASWCW